MSNISTCSDLYYTDENGKEHSLLKLYAYGKCVWKKEEAGVWIYVVSITDNKRIYFQSNYLHVSKADTIDWGDGTVTKGVDMVNKSVIEHTYEKDGVYTITYTDTKKANTSYGIAIYQSEVLQKIIHPDYCTEICVIASNSGDISIEYVMPTKITKVISVYCGIVNMNVPIGVIEIESSAFTHATKMKKITLPDTLKTIDSGAFEKAISLEDISLPDSVTSIGQRCFCDTSALKEIKLSESLTTIPYQCFQRSGIERIVFPASVKTIDGYAFHNCYYLKEINLPDTITSISNYAFYNTEKTESIRFSNNITTIPQYSFYKCGSANNIIKSLIIPENVTSIGNYAFYMISRIDSLVFNFKLKTIGEYAFYNSCGSVSNINFPVNLISIGQYAFDYNAFETITIPTNVISIGTGGFNNSKNLTSLVIGQNNTSSSYINIGNGCFQNSPKLTSITINRPISTIGSGAFNGVGRWNLVTLVFNASVNVIGQRAFEDVQTEKLSFPSNLRIINSYAFKGNDVLKILSLPNTLRTIGEQAFYGNWNLEEIDIPASVTSIGKEAFLCNASESSSVKKIIVRGNPTIGEYALGFYSNYHRHADCTFYGVAGSNTETYAKENGFDFVAI